jgi:hypothetical protein
MTDQEASETTKSAASKLFDIRVLIGGLFSLYGVLLTIYSFFTSDVELKKAAGININLGLGLGMLGMGLLFLLWVRLAPIQHPDPGPVDTDRPAAQ